MYPEIFNLLITAERMLYMHGASNEYHIPNQGKMSTATRIWKYYFVNYS
jgi:hypothetical protein